MNNRQIKKPITDRKLCNDVVSIRPKPPSVKNADEERIRQLRSRKEEE